MEAIITPPPLRKSIYGDKVDKKRAVELPNIVSVRIRDLFPDTPEPIYPKDKGIANIRRATEEALATVDFSKIKRNHSVNILASHHGFTILGGEPYAEMIRTIKDYVEKQTGVTDIRLRVGVGLRFREGDEYIKLFKLDEYFNKKAVGIAPVDEGVPIETEVGTLYGLKKAYDADWIIHTHNTDVREVHFHRMVDRMVKAFGMSYARIETRSAYHQNFGPRGANFVARAIFDSHFVQNKWAFACFLKVMPSGIIGVDAGNNLYDLDKKILIENLKHYGKIMTLLGAISECIVILDFSSPIPYCFAGGCIFANIASMHLDLFDLEKLPLPPYTFYTEAFYDENRRPLSSDIHPVNPAIKALVINHAFVGYPSVFFAEHFPTIIVGESQANLFRMDPQNVEFMKHALVAYDLDTAMEFAYKTAKTDKAIIFDGAAGGINVSESLAKELEEKAPEISRKVDQQLPRWLKQRGIE
ncbi:MAG: hypothetical protein QXX08_03615 [Candidatus Bathyarchaeia archaeon]